MAGRYDDEMLSSIATITDVPEEILEVFSLPTYASAYTERRRVNGLPEILLNNTDGPASAFAPDEKTFLSTAIVVRRAQIFAERLVTSNFSKLGLRAIRTLHPTKLSIANLRVANDQTKIMVVSIRTF